MTENDKLMTNEQINVVIKASTESGMAAFRRELEDENQHLDDAVRIGIMVAMTMYATLLRKAAGLGL